MDPEQVGHLPLALPPAATETPVFSVLKNESLISVGQLCDDVCQAIFNKNPFKSWIKIKPDPNRQAQQIRWSMGHPTDTD